MSVVEWGGVEWGGESVGIFVLFLSDHDIYLMILEPAGVGVGSWIGLFGIPLTDRALNTAGSMAGRMTGLVE